jgi:amino acid permease
MWTSLFGPKWSWAPDLVIVVFCGTAVVSYLIVVGDFLPRGLSALGVPLMDRQVYILAASICILPLNLMEDLSALSFTSVIGNFSILYTVGLLIYLCSGSDLDADWEPWEMQPGIFVTIPALAFSFNGHFGAPQMYQQLQSKSPKRWLKVTMISFFSICLPVVLVCALSGYLMFGSQLTLPDRSNILMAPSLNGFSSVTVAFIAMMFACLFNIPIATSCVKNAVDSILVNKFNADASKAAVSKRKRMHTLIIVAITLPISLATSSLGLSVAINGAVCATLMMFVFPALMFMKSSPNVTSRLFERALPITTMVLGLIIGIAGVTTTVMLDMGMQSELVKQ